MLDCHVGWGGAGDGSSDDDRTMEERIASHESTRRFNKEEEMIGKHGLMRNKLCKLGYHEPSKYHLELTCKYCGVDYGSYEDRLALEKKPTDIRRTAISYLGTRAERLYNLCKGFRQ